MLKGGINNSIRAKGRRLIHNSTISKILRTRDRWMNLLLNEMTASLSEKPEVKPLEFEKGDTNTTLVDSSGASYRETPIEAPLVLSDSLISPTISAINELINDSLVV